MSKAGLMAAAAAFALTAGTAMAAAPSIGAHSAKIAPVMHPTKSKMLWNQNSNSNGQSVVSQNFTSGSYSTYDSQGADDFVVPTGQKWKISEVDVTGVYFNGYGPATSEDVYFYSDNGGMPGALVKHGAYTDLVGTDTAGSFAIMLPNKALSLKPGTYWVSVVANCSFAGGCGEWGWAENATITGNQAMWQNPGGGFGTSCSSWGTVGSCTGYSGDFMFDLQGHSRHK